MNNVTRERIAEGRALRAKAHRWWASTVPSGQHDDYKQEAIPALCHWVTKLLDDLEGQLPLFEGIATEEASAKEPIAHVTSSEAVTKTRPRARKKK